MSDLVNSILASCEVYGDSIALSGGATQITYRKLAQQILEWEELFRAHGPNQRVNFSLANCPQYVPALYGAIRAGATPFLLDPGLPEAPKKILSETLGLNLILSSEHSKLEWFGKEQEVGQGLVLAKQTDVASKFELKSDTALCRFTSGTSGIPKCLEFSHNSVFQAGKTWAEAHHYGPDDTILCLAAFFNGLAFNTSFSSVFLSGATLLLYPSIPAAPMVIRYAIENAATRLVAFPLFYQMATKSTATTLRSSKITSAYSAASRLQDDTREEFHKVHGVSIVDYYGLAEVGPVTFEPDAGAVEGNGIALPGCEIRLREGMLQVKTPYRASSYLNFPGKLEARVDEDGFVATEDYAKIDNDRLFLTGRADGVINVAGQKFDPSDTVEALRSIDGLSDAFVFGADIGDGSHEVCAAVSGNGKLSDIEIRKILSAKIEAYKIPSRIEMMKEIPRNGVGKPYTNKIMELFQRERDDA